MPRWLLVLLAIALAYEGYRIVCDWPVGGVAAAPIVLGEEPVQEELEKPIPRMVHRDGRTFFAIQTHRYAVTGRVLSAHLYDLAWTSEVFDVDVGLAWGDQVDRLVNTYDFYQDARWLFWRSTGPVAEDERAYITTHVGNVHTLPAEGNTHVGRALRSVRAGDLVALTGFLVIIEDASTEVLARSSTSRSDTGNGACEVMWVDRIQIGGKMYQ